MKERLRDASLSAAAFLVYSFMRVLWYSSRKRYHFIDPIEDGQYIIASWHCELLMIPIYRHIRPGRSASAIISQHKDGEIVARVLSYMNIKPLRGSTRKGARKVFIEALRAMRRGDDIQVTPDGPRGPRYHVNDGAAALALKGGLPLMIIGYRARNYWQLKSWDKFIIPKPFTRIDFYIQSISVQDMDIESANALIREKMLRYALP